MTGGMAGRALRPEEVGVSEVVDSSTATASTPTRAEAIAALGLYEEYSFWLSAAVEPTFIHVLRLPGGLLYSTYVMHRQQEVEERPIQVNINTSTDNAYYPPQEYSSPTRYDTQHRLAAQAYIPISVITGV